MPKKQQLELLERGIATFNYPGIHYYFIGDFDPETDDYSRRCLKIVERNQLSGKVTFLGYQQDVEYLYNAMDLVLIASKREGLARCMIESISAGTPVLSFDVCSAREILEKYNCGWVVNSGEYKTMMNTISSIVKNRSELDDKAKNGYELSRKLFDSNVIVQSYEQLYNSLL